MLKLALFLSLIITLSAIAVEGVATTLNDGSFEKTQQGDIANKNKMDDADVMDRLKNISEVDPKEWGIRNGCINLRRIKNIRFVDDQSAVIEMRGNKKALLRLRRECPGIKREGFLHEARSGQLCARFDRLEVRNRGFPCSIESIEPYFDVESHSDSDKGKTVGDPK